jgi:hypothetical protein
VTVRPERWKVRLGASRGGDPTKKEISFETVSPQEFRPAMRTKYRPLGATVATPVMLVGSSTEAILLRPGAVPACTT